MVGPWGHGKGDTENIKGQNLGYLNPKRSSLISQSEKIPKIMGAQPSQKGPHWLEIPPSVPKNTPEVILVGLDLLEVQVGRQNTWFIGKIISKVLPQPPCKR